MAQTPAEPARIRAADSGGQEGVSRSDSPERQPYWPLAVNRRPKKKHLCGKKCQKLVKAPRIFKGLRSLTHLGMSLHEIKEVE
ncbi:MAG: hypothetical protein IJ268_11795 [Proteobacteria bacterium]|nr:hypothetical protein [Pseudomonadota bacterium]